MRASDSRSTYDRPSICTTFTCPDWPLTMSVRLCCAACERASPGTIKNTNRISQPRHDFFLIRPLLHPPDSPLRLEREMHPAGPSPGAAGKRECTPAGQVEAMVHRRGGSKSGLPIWLTFWRIVCLSSLDITNLSTEQAPARSAESLRDLQAGPRLLVTWLVLNSEPAQLLQNLHERFPFRTIASTIRRVKDSAPSPILRLLQGAAYTVIILWGIRAASPVLGPLLLGLLLAYALVPFPKWLMRRFKFKKPAAIAMTAVAVAGLGLYLLLTLDLATVRIAAKLPVYEQRLASLYEQVTVYMTAHGMNAPELSVKSVLTPERLREISRVLLPEAGAIISTGLLISLLGFLFLMEMAEEIGGKPGPLGEHLAQYESDARSYVAVTAKTAGINALVNLVFLIVMGVDTPVVWSFLYFM